jgi:hypothetical protein
VGHVFRSAIVACCLVGSALVAPSGSPVSAFSQSFTATGSEQSFPVPADVSSIHVVAIGGHGAGSSPAQSARVEADITVTPSSTLFVNVGGNASGISGGFNGGGSGSSNLGADSGGGGGSSDVRTCSRSDATCDDLTAEPDTRTIVAAGSGGEGSDIISANGGAGGAAGSDGDDGDNPNGGTLGTGGGAGTTSSGGAAGTPGNATSGSRGSGGNGSSAEIRGGGGGSGLFGGGGGGGASLSEANASGGGGGGGGSSLVPSGGGLSLTSDAPSITISYFVLTVTTAGAGTDAANATGAVSSSPPGVTCSRTGGSNTQGDCTEGYAAGSSVTVTATPDANSTAGISGACTAGPGAIGAAVNCQATMDADKSVTATFTRALPFTLTAATAGAGTNAANASGTLSSNPSGITCSRTAGANSQGDCTETYTSGTVVLLTATPGAGTTATISGACSAGPGAVGVAVSCSTTMNAAKTATATFTRNTSTASPTPTPIDTTPPNTTITAGPTKSKATGTTAIDGLPKTTDRTPDFTFRSSEADSTFECSVDGSEFVPCSSPYTTPKLRRGLHDFSVRAIDLAGNVDPTPASVTFKVKAKRKKR